MANHAGRRFVWNDALNIIFCREVLIHRPYQHKSGTKDAARSWEGLVETLTSDKYKEFKFPSKPKSMQDHLKILTDNRISFLTTHQENDSDTQFEGREIDALVDRIICDRNNFLQVLSLGDKSTKAANVDTQVRVEDVWSETSVESHDKIQKRKLEHDIKPRKAIRNGSEAASFIARRRETRRIQEEEMKIRREEMEARGRVSEATQQTMLEMIKSMQEHQQIHFKLQQQQQEQQFQLYQQQQQQQFQLCQQQQQQQLLIFSALVEKLRK